MVGAGALVSLLLGFDDQLYKNLTIIAVGILMIFYVTVGGMKGTTYIQIVKALLLMTGASLLTLLVMIKFGGNVSDLLGTAAEKSGKGKDFLEPGGRFGKDIVDAAGEPDARATLYSKLDLISLGFALVLGTAGLPHILIRFYTVPTARAARKSVVWGIWIIGSFYLMTLALGFGAAALVGPEAIIAQDPSGNTAAPQLARVIGADFFGTTGGTIMLAFIASVAFATILAVVAGLTLASSSSVAHDIYANYVHRGDAPEGKEVKVARISAFVIGAVAIVLSIFAQKLNVAFLVALAFAVAASGNLPAILYSLFWKRFNTTGAVSAIYGGLVSALVLVIFSPVVSGKPAVDGKSPSLVTDPSIDFSWFPLDNPGLVSIPLGFFFGWLGTVLSKEHNERKAAELEVRSLTGIGMEKATDH